MTTIFRNQKTASRKIPSKDISAFPATKSTTTVTSTGANVSIATVLYHYCTVLYDTYIIIAKTKLNTTHFLTSSASLSATS